MQAQADCSGLSVRRPPHLESTARGVALMAGQEAGVVADLEPLRQQLLSGACRFSPQLSDHARQAWRCRWQEAVRRCLHWQGEDHV